MGLDWIESNGGPLILLEGRLLGEWEGTDPPSNGRVVQASFRWQGEGPATDYDRACDVKGWLGLVPVGDGHGLVLNDEPLPTTVWRPDPADPVMLLRWEYAEIDGDVARHLEDTRGAMWQPWEKELLVKETEPLLFDSAFPGTEAYERRVVPLPPGPYGIELAHWRPDDLTSLILIRFLPWG